MLQSGLSLYHDAGARSLDVAAALSSGNPEQMVDGTVALMAAAQAAKIAGKVVHVVQEVDQAMLDILA